MPLAVLRLTVLKLAPASKSTATPAGLLITLSVIVLEVAPLRKSARAPPLLVIVLCKMRLFIAPAVKSAPSLPVPVIWALVTLFELPLMISAGQKPPEAVNLPPLAMLLLPLIVKPTPVALVK